MVDHEISVRSYPYFSAPFVFVAECSCGEYASGKSPSERAVLAAGNAHVRGKNRKTFPTKLSTSDDRTQV